MRRLTKKHFFKIAFFLPLALTSQLILANDTDDNIHTDSVEQHQKIIAASDASRSRNIRIGLYLMGMGITQICIAGLDYYFHTDTHEEGWGFEEHEQHEEHEEHEIPHEITRIMRITGHASEGSLTFIAGAIRFGGAIICNNDRTFKQVKVVSSTIQAASFSGTALASAADFGHGHISHGICHLLQTAATLSMTIPDIALWRNSRSSATISDSDKSLKKLKNISNIAASFADAGLSCTLAVLITSPLYAIEGIFNICIGVDNLVVYRHTRPHTNRTNQEEDMASYELINRARDQGGENVVEGAVVIIQIKKEKEEYIAKKT